MRWRWILKSFRWKENGNDSFQLIRIAWSVVVQAPVKVWRSSIKVSTPTDYGVPLSKPTLQNASNLPTGNWSPALALLETAFCFTLPESFPALPPAIFLGFDSFQERAFQRTNSNCRLHRLCCIHRTPLGAAPGRHQPASRRRSRPDPAGPPPPLPRFPAPCS